MRRAAERSETEQNCRGKESRCAEVNGYGTEWYRPVMKLNDW